MSDLISRQAVLKLLSTIPPEEAMTKAMLIQSVKQMDSETVTECNNLISRQAAIDAINKLCPIDTEYDCTLLDRVDVRCVLTDLPSTQQKRGRWIKEYNGNGWNDYWDYTCSACEKTLKRGEPYPYCPNCGARMEASDD